MPWAQRNHLVRQYSRSKLIKYQEFLPALNFYFYLSWSPDFYRGFALCSKVCEKCKNEKTFTQIRLYYEFDRLRVCRPNRLGREGEFGS
jgi:hypothetical protein